MSARTRLAMRNHRRHAVIDHPDFAPMLAAVDRAVASLAELGVTLEEAGEMLRRTVLSATEPSDETVGMTVDDLIDNIDELLASRTPESTKGDTDG